MISRTVASPGSAASASASSRIVTSPWIMIPCSSGNRSLRSTSTVQRGSRRLFFIFWPRQYAQIWPSCQANHSGVELIRPDGDTVEMRMFHSLDRIASRSSSDRARSRDRAMTAVCLLLVQTLEVVGVVGVDDVALELQRRRQLAVLEREVARQDGEPLDLLDLRVVAVGVVE